MLWSEIMPSLLASLTAAEAETARLRGQLKAILAEALAR
jgi:hypothetical protein